MQQATILKTLLLLSMFCSFRPTPALATTPSPELQWLWIYGRLDDPKQQQAYMEHLTNMFQLYQQQGVMKGRLISETDAPAQIRGHIVIAGPISAFEHFDRFHFPIQVGKDGAAVIGGHPFTSLNTGIFMCSRDGERVLFSGLSLNGFKTIFSVPTGDPGSVVITTAMGRIGWEGTLSSNGVTLREKQPLEPLPEAQDIQSPTTLAQAKNFRPVTVPGNPETDAPAFRQWLLTFVNGKRILMLGEGHWNRAVNTFSRRIISFLTATADVACLAVEVEASLAPFLNAYVHEPDATRARFLYQEYLCHQLHFKSELDILNVIRTNNLSHPEKPVQVIAFDLEWERSEVIRKILVPYFRRLDPDFVFPKPSAFKTGDRYDIPESLRKLQQRAHRKHLRGSEPFVTPGYVDTVLTNLRDTYAFTFDSHDFCWREKKIIGNIKRQLATCSPKGLVIFKTGGWHAWKAVEGSDCLHLAAYLNTRYAPTKAKVGSILINPVAYGFQFVENLEPDEQNDMPYGYRNLLNLYARQKALGESEPGRFYLDPGTDLADWYKPAVVAGQITGCNILQYQPAVGQPLSLEDDLTGYDAIFVVLRGQLEPMIPCTGDLTRSSWP